MTVSRFWSEQERTVPAPVPRTASTAISNTRIRSSTVIEKNSPCLPAMNTPSMPRSSTQCRMFDRVPASSIDPSARKGWRAAAQIPCRWARA